MDDEYYRRPEDGPCLGDAVGLKRRAHHVSGVAQAILGEGDVKRRVLDGSLLVPHDKHAELPTHRRRVGGGCGVVGCRCWADAGVVLTRKGGTWRQYCSSSSPVFTFLLSVVREVRGGGGGGVVVAAAAEE